ncbi:MAG: uL13 family ribosomal protein [Patescibacteria group bacterium]
MKKTEVKTELTTEVKKEAKTELIKELKLIDAAGKTLGRVASNAALFLMGKNNAAYQRHTYSGYPVKIINASKIKITPKKLSEIQHLRYSGRPGGLKIMKASYTVKTKGYPELMKLAIFQMLPDNKLRKTMMTGLIIEN